MFPSEVRPHMKIRVSNIMLAPQMAADWADQVISLVDPRTEVPDFAVGDQHLIIRCTDTESAMDPWAIRRYEVEEMFRFVKPVSNVLVHCEGGISRSTAVGISLLVFGGATIGTATDKVHEQRPNLSPNRLILRYADDILNLNGELSNTVNTMVAAYPKTLMLWCGDCGVEFPDEEGANCPGRHFSS